MRAAPVTPCRLLVLCLAAALVGQGGIAHAQGDTRLVAGLQHHMLYGIQMQKVDADPLKRAATLELFKFSRSDNPECVIVLVL